MIFVETPVFTRRITALLTNDEYAVLQFRLAEYPDLGDVIPESGGIRKLRVAVRGRGKSGGARVIYYWLVGRDRIFLMSAYAKNEKTDLTHKEIKALRRAVEEELR
jgi:hypothetical protein